MRHTDLKMPFHIFTRAHLFNSLFKYSLFYSFLQGPIWASAEKASLGNFLGSEWQRHIWTDWTWISKKSWERARRSMLLFTNLAALWSPQAERYQTDAGGRRSDGRGVWSNCSRQRFWISPFRVWLFFSCARTVHIPGISHTSQMLWKKKGSSNRHQDLSYQRQRCF